MNNRQVRLKARPQGIPQAEHFEIVEAVVPELAEGQVLIRNIYLSVDPAMRGWIVDKVGYSAPVPIGEVMRSFASGRVEASRLLDRRAQLLHQASPRHAEDVPGRRTGRL